VHGRLVLIKIVDPYSGAWLCRSEYVAMGMYHISKAVAFLNNDCKLVRPRPVACAGNMIVWESVSSQNGKMQAPGTLTPDGISAFVLPNHLFGNLRSSVDASKFCPPVGTKLN
jgi:hypothetical protein